MAGRLSGLPGKTKAHCNGMDSARIYRIMRDPSSPSDLRVAVERARGAVSGGAGAPACRAGDTVSRYSQYLPEADRPEDAAMLRTCLCLLIAFASATVAAREIKLSDANSGSCPDNMVVASSKDQARAAPRSPAPVRESKAKPGIPGDVGNSRQQSPRWHSFLPGMFR